MALVYSLIVSLLIASMAAYFFPLNATEGESAFEAGELLSYWVVGLISALAAQLARDKLPQTLSMSLATPDTEEGSVKWFNVNKGYGFIVRDNGGEIFVHYRGIKGRGHRMLSEGQRVRFQVAETEKGLQADHVEPLS